MKPRKPPTLSPRLQQLVDLIEGRTLADIGTDHAYVPVSACLSGKIETAIACDLKAGPLAKAEDNIRRHGLSHRIVTRLGNGLQPLSPGEAACLIIAGMGGMNIADILTQGLPVARAATLLLLQPQHDIPRLRKALHAHGFAITEEHILREASHFYWILSARPAAEAVTGWSELEYLWGKPLLARKDPTLRAFLERERQKTHRYIENIGGGVPEALRAQAALYTEAMDLWR